MQYHIIRYSKQYQVEPEFVAAVMRNESEFKCGPLGKKGTYIGPGGINKCFRKKWDIDDPVENIRVVVMSLQNTESDEAKVRRLKRYNKKWWENRYIPDVMTTYRQYKREGIFD